MQTGIQFPSLTSLDHISNIKKNDGRNCTRALIENFPEISLQAFSSLHPSYVEGTDDEFIADNHVVPKPLFCNFVHK